MGVLPDRGTFFAVRFKTSYAFDAIINIDNVIPYLDRIENTYESREMTPELY